MAESKPEIITIEHYGDKLDRPFTMIELAQIDDLSLSLFLCQGVMPQHRHLDQDELFLVHSGTISLDSEWGNAILRAGELAVAPKGFGHRSSALHRSLVLLLQPNVIVDRRNGDRRLFAQKEGHRLEKISLPALGRQIAVPFQPVLVTHLDTFAVNLTLCQGIGPWQQADHQASLVLCCEGGVLVETEQHRLPIAEAELVVLPAGTRHRLSGPRRGLVVGVQRHTPPGARPSR